MKKIFLLLAVAGMCLTINAQDTLVAPKKCVAADVPTIDGVADEGAWASADQHDITKWFSGDTINGDADLSGFFKTAWDETALYVFVSVTDDVHYPSGTFGENWEKDIVEVYFDMYPDSLKDGKGASAGLVAGHGQIAPVAAEGTAGPDWLTGEIAIKVDGTNYTYEMSVPWADLANDDFAAPSTEKAIGFDVTIVDNDGVAVYGKARRRLCWVNDGAVNENWGNMDGAGYLQVSNDPTSVTNAVVSKSTLTVKNGSLYIQNASASVIEIYNLTGMLVKSEKISNNDVVNISNLKPGIYLTNMGKISVK
jgi:hypothetical protein